MDFHIFNEELLSTQKVNKSRRGRVARPTQSCCRMSRVRILVGLVGD